MNEEVNVEKKRCSPPRGAGGAKTSRRFTVAEKLKAIRLSQEEGFSLSLKPLHEAEVIPPLQCLYLITLT
jgi:hypothetical protein